MLPQIGCALPLSCYSPGLVTERGRCLEPFFNDPVRIPHVAVDVMKAALFAVNGPKQALTLAPQSKVTSIVSNTPESVMRAIHSAASTN